GLAKAISNQLQSKIPFHHSLSNPSDAFKHIKIPDYFSEFKNHPEWSGYLGGCIVAKLIFSDASSSKLWMSKPDYSKEGPYISRKIVGINSSS
ncbi:hypothetical protein O181_109734, partial [Austropuccinia psidii MF-1]|nr:hypothetical protein [Austropuccinia psidii MF-1]